MVGEDVADEDEEGEEVVHPSQDPDHLSSAGVVAHVWHWAGEVKEYQGQGHDNQKERLTQ